VSRAETCLGRSGWDILLAPAMRRLLLLVVLAVTTFQGCACETVPSDALTRCEASAVVPGSVETDILFVIDDSPSMDPHQANLASNLDAFIQALASSTIANDFRVGVTTSSVERFDGATTYLSGPAAGVPYPAGALVAVTPGTPGGLIHDAATGFGGARILDRGDANMIATFQANVRVGDVGSGKEEPFRAARLALTDRLRDANAGFLRPGARLAVIFLTDEDDCSDTAAPFATANDTCHEDATKDADPPTLDRVAEFASFLLGPIGGEQRDVALGIIAGVDPAAPQVASCRSPSLCSNTACSSAVDGADRFLALPSDVGASRVALGSICDATFANSLERFAKLLVPTRMPLPGAPADWRLLVVGLTRAADGGTVTCKVKDEGSPDQAAADAVYVAPRFGAPAELRFQNACTLELGDQIDVKIVCAG
jgi:hypothetical protein